MDDFNGQGGSYLLDPETGKRTLVERTQEAEQPAQIEQPEAVAADEQGGE